MHYSKVPIISTLVTFVAVVIMFALGVWQLQRADEKQLRLVSIQQAAISDPLTLTSAINLGEAARDFPIQLKGVADTQHYFLLDNRIHQGQVGYEVYVPIDSSQGILLVNFGWVAAPSLRENLPSVQLPRGASNYQGMLSIPLQNKLITETAQPDQQWPKVIQQIDLGLLSKLYRQSFLPFVVLLDKEADSPFIRDWQPVVMPPEKHVAYAIQWFLLAFSAAIIFIIAQSRKSKREVK